MVPFLPRDAARRLRVVGACAGLLIGALAASAQTIIVDNNNANNAAGHVFTTLSGTWSTGTSSTDKYLNDYRFISSAPGGTSQAEWRPTLPTAGDYRVSVWYPVGSNRATDAPYTVHYAGGTATIDVNQQVAGGTWNVLGTYTFNAGTTGSVSLSSDAQPMVVLADGVRFEKIGGSVAPEWRALWVTRFEWPSTNKTTVQNYIIDVMTKLQANNFNAVVFQMRGQCDTLYPSPYEPWSPLVSPNGNEPSGWNGFDPLQFAIDQAHAHNLEFHAYINTHVGWQSGSNLPPNYAPGHIWWQHLNASDANHRDWLIHNSSGTPVGFEESGYVWMAAGVPDMQAYVRQQVMYVVENYDVDGVHYDRIRSPGSDYSYDPISTARKAGDGNPNSLAHADWMRDQITRFTQDLYAQIMEVKPWIKVSSAPLGLYLGTRYGAGYPTSACGFQYGYSCVYQDAQGWLAAGSQDFICPQIYWADGGSKPDFSDVLPDWVAHNGGRHIYAGQTNSVGISALLSQVNVTRAQGGQGNIAFSFGSFNSNNYWANYTAGPYASPAALPAMPWKDSPTDGVIIGNVVIPGGDPVVDAHITRTGSSYISLSSGDGLYSFLKVPPGTYTINVDKPGVGTRQVTNVSVVAGQVTRVDVVLGDVPCDYDNDGVVDLGDLTQFAFCNQGPDVTIPPGNACLKCDLDANQHIDLADFAGFMRLIGP